MLTITSAFLLGLAAGVGAQPRISTSDGDVILASPTDVRVVRQDPDGDGSGRSGSLFGMLDQVEALPSTIATAVSTLRDDISTSGAAQTRAFEGFLSGNLSAVSARLNATVADLDRLNVTVDAAVTNNGNVQAALARTDSALRSSISALESAAVASASCFAAGMVMTSTGCGYPPVMTDRVAGYTCTNSTFGRTRWNHNVSFYEVCSPGATGIPIFQPVYRPPPYGSEGNPAASGAALLANRPNAGSGLYWIQPAGDALPAGEAALVDWAGKASSPVFGSTGSLGRAVLRLFWLIQAQGGSELPVLVSCGTVLSVSGVGRRADMRASSLFPPQRRIATWSSAAAGGAWPTSAGSRRPTPTAETGT